MIPLHELLSRIRWDAEFARGNFRIAYYDRVLDRLIDIPLTRMHAEPDSHFTFDVIDAEGRHHSIPYHRIKQVWKDDALIWHREH